jgi:predicted PurR-regulated permease PerM
MHAASYSFGMKAGFPRGTVILVALAAATVTAVGLSSIRGILAPTLLTLVLVICANPVRNALLRRGVPGAIATGSVILVVFGLLAGFVYAIIIALAQFVAMLPDYADRLTAVGASLADALHRVGVDAEQIQSLLASIDPANIAGLVTGAVGSVTGVTASLVIVLTMMILMAADAVYARTVLNQLRGHRPDLVAALAQYAADVRRYMVVTTGLGIAQGALNALVLSLLHVPAALLWGLLAFLCSFIPNVGYFFALIPPMFFGGLVGGWPTVIAVVVLYGLINAIVQSVIQPRVVGKAVSLSQTVTFFSVLLWAVILGPVGAILAIPLTLLAKAVLIDANPDAHWWRPALGPTDETRSIAKAESRPARPSPSAPGAKPTTRRGLRRNRGQ